MEVIANGIDTDGEYAASRVEAARAAAVNTSGNRRTMVFLSRIHHKKGLDLLCEAWSTLPKESSTELLIAGDGEPDLVAQLRRWVAGQSGPPAHYLGPVGGEEKLRLLAAAWALVLPSRSENYGMAVAEALACGTPVLTTTATPWAEFVERECGWLINPCAVDVAHALREILTISEDAHAALRTRARLFVEEAHSLRATGAAFEALYGALMPGSKVPRDVR